MWEVILYLDYGKFKTMKSILIENSWKLNPEDRHSARFVETKSRNKNEKLINYGPEIVAIRVNINSPTSSDLF